MKTVVAILVLAFSVFLCGCEKTPAVSFDELPSPVASTPGIGYIEGKELYALTAKEEEAKQIAETYGIVLVEFSHGVAVFHTADDPCDVIKKGQENGWPSLELNYTVQKY